MRGRLAVWMWLTVGLLLAAPGLVAPRSAVADEPAVDQRVRDRIAARGQARVLVELRLPQGQATAEGLLPDEVAVRTQRSDIAAAGAQVMGRLAHTRHRLARSYESVPLLALEIGPDGLAELEAAGSLVARVTADSLRAAVLDPSVALIGAPAAWAAGFDGTGTVVAVLDTGVDRAHPFLAGKVVAEACFSTTSAALDSTSVCPNGQESQIGPGAGVPCPDLGLGCWHGTHVAGIAAGNGDQAGQSLSGVAKGAQIIAVQVFSRIADAGRCGGAAPCVEAWDSDIIAGLEHVYALRTQRRIAAVNLSLGSGLFSSRCDGEPEKAIIDNLRAAGIATVVAAGNEGSTTAINSPACISSAVSVGASDDSDVIADYTNVSRTLSVLAPGNGIVSAYPGGAWVAASGTSMATAVVTGAFAILKDAAPAATVQALLEALQDTGVSIADTRLDGRFSTPRIRVDAALGPFTASARPLVRSLSPSGAIAGGPAFTLTVTGSNFVSSSVVRWRGSNRPTTFVDSGTLTAAIRAADIAGTGVAQVSVANGPPGGAVSNSLPFAVGATASGTLSVRVSKIGSGEGRVVSAPAGIDCGSACTRVFAPGSVVTLTAIPAAGSTFGGWSGACTGRGACRVTVSAAKSVVARFRQGR